MDANTDPMFRSIGQSLAVFFRRMAGVMRVHSKSGNIPEDGAGDVGVPGTLTRKKVSNEQTDDNTLKRKRPPSKYNIYIRHAIKRMKLTGVAAATGERSGKNFLTLAVNKCKTLSEEEKIAYYAGFKPDDADFDQPVDAEEEPFGGDEVDEAEVLGSETADATPGEGAFSEPTDVESQEVEAQPPFAMKLETKAIEKKSRKLTESTGPGRADVRELCPTPTPTTGMDLLSKKQQKRAKAVTSASAKHARALGGGEGLIGFYGTLSRKSIVSVMHYMNCVKRLKNSHFVDAGAGLHCPGVYASGVYQVSRAWGFEMDLLKVKKARELCLRVGSRNCKVSWAGAGKRKAKVIMQGCSHLFAFWDGWAPEDKLALGTMVRKYSQARVICVVQQNMTSPEKDMAALNFPGLRLKYHLKVHISGSGSQRNAYIFRRHVPFPAPL